MGPPPPFHAVNKERHGTLATLRFPVSFCMHVRETARGGFLVNRSHRLRDKRDNASSIGRGNGMSWTMRMEIWM